MTIKFNSDSNDQEFYNDGWGIQSKSRKPSAMDKNHFKIKGHIFGPHTVKIGKWFKDFKAGLQTEYKLNENGKDEMEVYFLINLRVEQRQQSLSDSLAIL